jgi:hypothetical protein
MKPAFGLAARLPGELRCPPWVISGHVDLV